MNPNRVSFDNVADFARFCAGLQREGIAFYGKAEGGQFVAYLTGY